MEVTFVARARMCGDGREMAPALSPATAIGVAHPAPRSAAMADAAASKQASVMRARRLRRQRVVHADHQRIASCAKAGAGDGVGVGVAHHQPPP